jgi:putative copper export protein
VVDLPAFLAATLIRWLGLLALATLVGSGVLDLVVLPRGRAELAAVRHRLARGDVIAVLVLLVATAGELLMRSRTMSGGGIAPAIGAMPVVLERTHFGTIWIARATALVLLLALLPARLRWARGLALLLDIGVALTTSLTGHAADWGDFSFMVFVDWSHVVAAAAWAGGLVVLALAVLVDRHSWPSALLGEIARRFSTLAGWCLLVVVASGLYNCWVQLPAISALWTTTYGRALALKVVFVGVVGIFRGRVPIADIRPSPILWRAEGVPGSRTARSAWWGSRSAAHCAERGSRLRRGWQRSSVARRCSSPWSSVPRRCWASPRPSATRATMSPARRGRVG